MCTCDICYIYIFIYIYTHVYIYTSCHCSVKQQQIQNNWLIFAYICRYVYTRVCFESEIDMELATENVQEQESMSDCGKERESFGDSGRRRHTPEGTREPCWILRQLATVLGEHVNSGEGGVGWWWVLFKHTIQAKKCTNVERALTRKRDTQKYAQSHTPFSFQVKLPCAAQEFNAGVSPKYDQKSVKCGSDWHDKIEKEQNTDKR